MYFEIFNSKIKKLANKKRSLALASLTAWAGLATGCQSTSYNELNPALLTEYSVTTQALITEIISGELSTQPVRVSKRVFIDTSWILIVKRERRSIDHPNTSAIDTQKPVKFQLMKSAENCYLVLSSNKKRWKLNKVSCRYE